jgi:hypothetical protein
MLVYFYNSFCFYNKVIRHSMPRNHCICIYNQWIYDSHFKNALVLTHKLLGVCCLSVDQETQFDGYANVVSFPDMYLLNSKK